MRGVPALRRETAGPAVASLALHALVFALLAALRPEASVLLPPTYRVDLVAAPPGPRQIGVVQPSAPPRPQTEAPPPPRAETPERAMPLPSATPPRRAKVPATPTPAPAERAATPSEAAPAAGGGPSGGRGTDVANVRIEGIQFPFPGYLNNIVRQIALRFHPDNPDAPLRAEIMFLIHRDGSVSSIRFLRRSGVYAFDLEAQGAIEAAAATAAFGPLPAAFRDDVLPVIFSFDPDLIR